MEYNSLNDSGIDPPADLFEFKEPIVLTPFIPCKKCGKDHGYGIKNMITGHFIPIDTCPDCFIFGSYHPVVDQVVLDDVEDMKNRLKSLESNILE